MNNKNVKTTQGSILNKFVAVVMALSLVFLQTPISGLSKEAQAGVSEKAKQTLAEQSAIDVPLEFEHAYIVYDDQTIAEPATKVTIPAEAAFKFKAEADSGYQVESVKATIGGKETEIKPNEKTGEFKLTASEVADTSKVVVKAISAPTVEGVEVATSEGDGSEAAESAESSGTTKTDAENAASGSTGETQAETSAADGADAGETAEPSETDEQGSPAGDAVAQAVENTQTEFTWFDFDAEVTAKLSRADAVPAGATFQVTRVTSSTKGYNYDAYLAALNDSGDAGYTSDNTLLYDVAFMVKNDDGNLVEFEPESGTVAISIKFKKDQLADGIDAQSTSDVEIKHLSLKSEVRDAVDSTADAIDISASDIDVTDVSKASADVAGEEVSFTVNSLSVVAVSSASSTGSTSSTATAITSDIADVTYAIYPTASDRSAGTNALTDDYEIRISQTLYGSVKFDFNAGEGPTTGRLTYTYMMPDNIVAADKAAATLYDDAGNVAGTWEIADNVVYFYYDETWALAHPTSGGHFNFDFTLNYEQTEIGTETVITFPGASETITVKVKDGEMSGSKWNSGVVNGVVTYTVQLTAEIDFDTFVFSDLLEKNLDYVEGSFTLDGNPLSVTIAENSDGTHTATAASQAISAGTHTITYQATVDQDAFDAVKNWHTVHDTDNTATWTYTKNGTTKSGSATSTIWLQKNIINKWTSGVKNGNQIKWTIQINGTNEMKSDLAGYTVTDKLQAGLTYGTSFTVYDANMNALQEVTIPSGATSFSYTFPSDAGSSTYYIKYYTTMSDTSQAVSYDNYAEITPPGSTEKIGKADKTYNYDPNNTPKEEETVTAKVTKEVSDESNKATTGVVTWHSKITSDSYPAGEEESGFTLEYSDTLDNWFNYTAASNGYTRYYRIWFTGTPTLYAGSTKLVNGVDYVFDETDAATTYGYTTYDSNYEGDTVPTAWRIRFIMNSDTMKQVVANSTDIDIYYDTQADGTYQTFYNTGRVSVMSGGYEVSGNSSEANYTLEGTNPVTKSGWTWWDDAEGAYVTQWEVVANRDGSYNCIQDLKSPILSVVDRLPEGLTVLEDSIDVYVVRPQSAGLSYIAVNPAYTFSQDGRDATFTVDLRNVELQSYQDPFYDEETGSCYAWMQVRFKTKVESEYVVHDGTEQTLLNTATFEAGGIPLGTAHAATSYKDEVITKTGTQSDGEPVVHYTIQVNPKGQTLVPGSDTATVNLKDLLDYRTTVVLSSIKVVDGDGNDITSQCVVTLSNSETDESGNATSAFSISVPDSTALTVTYDVVLSGADGQYLEITNEASLSGITSKNTESKQWFKVNHADAGVYGSNTSISITKSDSSNALSTLLEGAVFELYAVDMSALPDGEWTEEGLAAASTLVNSVTTDSSGSATLVESTTSAIQYDTLYYFKEVSAPAGYAVDDLSPHFVMTAGSNYSAQYAAAVSHGITPSQNTVYNVTDTQKTSTLLKAQKVLENGTISAGDYSFELREGDKLIETASCDADGVVTFSNIEYDAAGTHTYTISEVEGSIDGVTYDTHEETVTVTVTKSGNGSYYAEASYASGGTAAVFTNTYNPTCEVSGTKAWDDTDDQDGLRPSEVTVHLLANGKDTGKR